MPLAGRFVVQSVSALLVIGLVALGAMVAMTIWLSERSRTHFEDVIAARDVRSAAVELRSAVQSAESSERGYVLTGNEIYLSPYSTARGLAMRLLQSLQTSSMPGTPPVLPRLNSLVLQKFSDMDRVIAFKQQREDAEALAIIRSNRGKLLMDEINLFVSGIVRAADERLTTGVAEQRSNAGRLRLAAIIAAMMIAVVVAGIVVTIYRYTDEIRTARDRVNALNENLEARVAGRTAELARANDEIQRFAHIVSHDLRAPLINVVGFTAELEAGLAGLQGVIETLPHDATGESVRNAVRLEMPEAISFIRASTRKMDSLISAILMVSREGQRRLQPETIRLSSMLEAARDAVQHQLQDAGGMCKLDVQADEIVSDRLSLEQILGNLFDNAVKYRAEDRALQISIKTRYVEPGQVLIEFSDNGRGIARHDHERVFELFRRAGRTDRPGEGVGLAYVRSIARNLKGEIGIVSELDRGTTFIVTLPSDLRRQAELAA
jgi:signal transduction histidine kinase